MSSKVIILVEDDLNLRQSIVLILERAGYLVYATECPYKAMDILRSGNYQVIISDFNMPDTKKVLLPKMHENYPNLFNVILTDQSVSEIDKEDKQLRDQYLIKPIAPERLLDCVGKILVQNENLTNNKLGSLPVNKI
jgi:DNA-binding NtrC family response regulator